MLKEMRLFYLSLFFFFSLFTNRTAAQQLSAAHLIALWKISDTTQTNMASKAYDDLEKHFNAVAANTLLAQLHKRIDAGNNLRLKVRLWLYEKRVMAKKVETPHHPFLLSKTELLNEIKLAHGLNDDQLLSELYAKFTNVAGAVTEEDMLYYTKLIEIRERIGVTHFPEMYRMYLFLSSALYGVGEYQQALIIGLHGLEVQKKASIQSIDAVPQFDIVGACYKEFKKADSMLYYYKAAKALLKSGTDVSADPSFKEIWQGVVSGGIAQAFYLMGKYVDAIPLLEQNIASSTLYKQWGDAALAQNTLADIYFEQQKSKATMGAYKKAYRWALQVHDFKNLAHAAFGIARNFKQQQLYDSGWSYYERYHEFSDSLSKITDRHLFALVNVKSDYDHLESTLQNVQLLAQRQKTVRNLIIVGIAILTIIILLLYNRRILQAKLEAERLENEKQLAEAKAAHSEEEIAFARQQLRDFSKNLSEKNKLIENLQAQFDSTEKLELNEMLRNFTILTGNDWLRFKDYFEKANPGYWQMLHQKLPNLSITEQRLFAFLKLGLGYKEMASATGVSAQSVRVALHRLRKKIEIALPGCTVEEMATKL